MLPLFIFSMKFQEIACGLGFPCGSDGKESARSEGDLGSIPESGRSPGERNGYPLQYSCLEISMDGGTRRATVHGVTESDTTERLIHWKVGERNYKDLFS